MENVPQDVPPTIEAKIAVALERISEAFRVLLWDAAKNHGLSPIQVQLLVFIESHKAEMCKVSFLASEFNMTKATISDSVKALVRKNLVLAVIDSSDTRSFTIALTDEGHRIARQASGFDNALEESITNLPETQKAEMYTGLLALIGDLNRRQIITEQRMCFNCAYYMQDSGLGFCKLLDIFLTEKTLRVDCPEFEPALT